MTFDYFDNLHAEKYRQEGETFDQAMDRISKVLGDDPEFNHLLKKRFFLPAGRIQSAIGASKEVTAFNCFVAPTIVDSTVNGDDCPENSIMDVATKAIKTLRSGGGIGYDFSTLRPKNAKIKKLNSHSSGAVSFMNIFDAICATIRSSGHRRGAQMGVLRVDHPDIEEFITAKRTPGVLTNFNVSVAITDKFMDALAKDEDFDLVFGGEVYKTVKASYLWHLIMETTYDWAEPGVIFIDRINDLNPLYYCERINSCNPCSEQSLPPNGACLLGSFNLVAYVEAYGVDYLRAFKKDIPTVVRAMDRVIDVSIYPLPEQKHEAHQKRRMGLGLTGVANAIEWFHECTYGDPKFLRHLEKIMCTLTNGAFMASSMLAKEKGSFPLFDKDKYLSGKFIQRLDPDVRSHIAEYGIRNSHLTSIAPTGTISSTAGNVSSGIEPVFAHEVLRKMFFGGVQQEIDISDYMYRVYGFKGKKAGDCTVKEHLDVLTLCQYYIDSAISKTINMDSKKMSFDEFKNIYLTAYNNGAKGCTTFNISGKRMGILVDKADTAVESKSEGGACVYNPETGEKSCEE
jgi:ribonucleoside-diphosphate reductase alpha chain